MTDRQRPTGITLATLVMALCLIAELILELKGQLPYLHGVPIAPGAIAFVISFRLLPKIAAATVLVFFQRGRDWALWLVIMSATLHLARLGLFAKNRWVAPPPLTAMPIAEAVIALFLLIYLNLPSIRAWFH